MGKKNIADKRFERINFVDDPLFKGEYEDCSLIDCDFSGSELSGIVFSDCEFIRCNLSLVKLSQTVFDNTNLEMVDFLTSYNYTIDPEKNKLKKTKFSSDGISGLLSKYHIIIE